jgi:hypothetical protein
MIFNHADTEQQDLTLSRGDDYPIHQTPEPVAYAGTDRNFYDRYFFNGYSKQPGNTSFFAAAFGVYPHLNIADAAFVVVRNGVETALHASRCLNMERMDISAGPIRIEVIEPLHELRVSVNAPDRGIAADIVFTGRNAPIEEPRFIRRIGPRTLMDYTRLTQNGRYQGWIELDGVRETVDGFVGTRDRSWGVRPVGLRDSQPLAPAVAPQFFWLWAPTNFESASLFFHTNDDAAGLPWNRRAVWAADGQPPREIENALARVSWKSGTRHAASATVVLGEGPQTLEATFTPVLDFFMLGLGYGHPKWGHGLNHGELAVEREDIVLSGVDVRQQQHLHVQALCDVTCRDADGRVHQGRGVLEQLALGPHAPSGFKSTLDPAP